MVTLALWHTIPGVTKNKGALAREWRHMEGLDLDLAETKPQSTEPCMRALSNLHPARKNHYVNTKYNQGPPRYIQLIN